MLAGFALNLTRKLGLSLGLVKIYWLKPVCFYLQSLALFKHQTWKITIWTHPPQNVLHNVLCEMKGGFCLAF